MPKLTYSTGWLDPNSYEVPLPTTATELHSLVTKLKKKNPRLALILFSADLDQGMTCGFSWNPKLSCDENVKQALKSIPALHKPMCRKAVQTQIFGIQPDC